MVIPAGVPAMRIYRDGRCLGLLTLDFILKLATNQLLMIVLAALAPEVLAARTRP